MIKGTATTKPLARSARPGVESLEDRSLLSGASLALSLGVALPPVQTAVSAGVNVRAGDSSLLAGDVRLGVASEPLSTGSSSGGAAVTLGGGSLLSDGGVADLGAHAAVTPGAPPTFLWGESVIPPGIASPASADTAAFLLPAQQTAAQPAAVPATATPLPVFFTPDATPVSGTPDRTISPGPAGPPAEDTEPPPQAPRGPWVPWDAGLRVRDAFGGELPPSLLADAAGTALAVEVGPATAARSPSVASEPGPEAAEAGPLTAALPSGTGLAAELERLLDQLNELGGTVKDALVNGRLGFWVLAGALAVGGCEVVRRQRRARERLALTAADPSGLRWFPEVA